MLHIWEAHMYKNYGKMNETLTTIAPVSCIGLVCMCMMCCQPVPRCLVDTQLVNWYFKPFDTAPFLTHLNGVIQAKVVLSCLIKYTMRHRVHAVSTSQSRLLRLGST